MEAVHPPYSESDILHCLTQSAILIDSISDRSQHGLGSLPMDEQREIARNLGIVLSALNLLHSHVIPSLVADGTQKSLLSQSPVKTLLMHMRSQLNTIQVRCTPPSPESN
jgi:hypothetical protein